MPQSSDVLTQGSNLPASDGGDAVSRTTFDQVMVPNYAPGKMIPVRGFGSRVWDQGGNEYVDFAGGIAVSALGHAHPELVSVLTQQAKQLWHLSNVLTNEPALRLARLLVDNTFADKVFFANSGAEANEAAFKLARRHAWLNFGPEKHEIIACLNGFHGRTLFTVSVGGQEKYTEGFGPIPQGITHIPYNDLESLKAAISDKTCAVVVEPIQGEGGVLPATRDFMKGVRALCDEYQALMILDEIQTGMGRTGELYAYMHYGIYPDVLTTAKALGGGFPIAAMLTRDQFAASLSVGSHGSTYGGNPLGCAVAEAVFNIVNTPEFLSGVRLRQEMMLDALERINRQYNVFKEIRGRGLLIGGELVEGLRGQSKLLLQKALDEHLMILVAGPDVMRLAPALNIPEEDIQVGMTRLSAAIGAMLREIE